MLRVASALTRRAVALPLRQLAPVAARSFAAVKPDAVMSADENVNLADVLQAELRHEKAAAGSDTVLKEIAAEFAKFKLSDSPGSARFTLERKFGSQEITVAVDCNGVEVDSETEEEGGAEGEEDEGLVLGYRVLITIKDSSKPSVLQFGGVATDYLQVHRVTCSPAGSEPSADDIFSGQEDKPFYQGPVFDDLDENLQNGVYSYLFERGMDDEFAAKLSEYANAKEQQEYCHWLGKVHEFVASK